MIKSRQVGTRKKAEILKKAKELGISALNLNIDEQIKSIEDFINSKKKRKEAKKDPKEKQESKGHEQKTGEPIDHTKKEPNESERAAGERDSSRASQQSPTSAQIMEKKEKDKLLTKKV
mgnify:FL=1